MSELQDIIIKVANREHLTIEESARAFQIIMMGGATPSQMAALLTGLRINGESTEEIIGAAQALRAKCIKVKAPENAIDTCGTGGDASGTYNISTAVAFVLAGGGVPVAKHGNRSVSSLSGSAEVLKELGVNIEADVSIMEKALEEANICFLMAPKFHQSMRFVAPVRKELEMRTIFNIVGPLANPASAKYHVLGVYSRHLLEIMAKVLKQLGVVSAWVVHGEDGLDELTTTGISYVASLRDGNIETFELTPEDAGLKRADAQSLEGGIPQHNAQALKRIISGSKDECDIPHRDIVLFNAAAGFIVCGLVSDIKDAVAMAADIIDSGKAKQALQKLVEITNS